MIIYLVTNLLNNKKYIGQTTRSLEIRIKQHKTRKNTVLYSAFKKYSFENFKIEIIDKANSIEELNLLEDKYIKEFNTLSPNGYNRVTGGNNKICSEETKEKMRISFKEARKKYPPARTGKTGKLHFKSKSVVCNETGEIFESARQAELKLGIQRTHILEICKGIRLSRNGLTFRFENESKIIREDLRGQWKKGKKKTKDGWIKP